MVINLIRQRHMNSTGLKVAKVPYMKHIWIPQLVPTTKKNPKFATKFFKKFTTKFIIEICSLQIRRCKIM